MTDLAALPSISPARAWLRLVLFCFVRQMRVRQMVWIALGLLALGLLWVGAVGMLFGWSLNNRPSGFRKPTFEKAIDRQTLALAALSPSANVNAVAMAATAAARATLPTTGLANFSDKIVFSLFLGLLLPLWSLCFGTNALGGERESRTLIWLVSRPVPRWATYLAMYLGLLPWCLALNVGGFALLCLVAGPIGWQAFALYWPAVLSGTLAFAALFHLIAAVFRRPAVVGLVYAFFLETFLSSIPGFVKRFSLIFYVRCQMFEASESAGLLPIDATMYAAVSGPVALAILLAITAGLLVVGAIWFERAEYPAEI